MATINRLKNSELNGSSLKTVNYDDIENKIMMVLLANTNKVYRKSELYNIVIDKFDKTTFYVDPQFKYKYMIVLNQLPSKYDVTINDNLISSNSDLPEDNLNQEFSSDNILPSKEDLSEYIIENDLHKNKSIYYDELVFDLIKGNKLQMVDKLLTKSDYSEYFNKKNIDNKTAIKYINSQQMTNIFLDKLNEEIAKLKINNLELENKLDNLKTEMMKNDINNFTISQFIGRKIKSAIKFYSTDIEFFMLIGLGILLLKADLYWIQFCIKFYLLFTIFGYLHYKIFGK